MFAPPPIRFSRRCERCGLRYPRKEKTCIHCRNLSDKEMNAMLEHKKKEHITSAKIGRLFLFITILIIIGIAASML